MMCVMDIVSNMQRLPPLLVPFRNIFLSTNGEWWPLRRPSHYSNSKQQPPPRLNFSVRAHNRLEDGVVFALSSTCEGGGVELHLPPSTLLG